ncbi:dienelactone hydrolase family protein [uncultured Flavobacterium sp.]|uniref:carboxylesterase family protein n=1 Tax=uncultured Flavobacterium sp. TaxID=165435 RepID=UPI0025FFD076|nr:dienelactone hydrolase family protein [uncultured Flavobacterium sp.]
MKIINTVKLLAAVLVFVSCSKDAENSEKEINTVEASMTQNSFDTGTEGVMGYWLYTPENPSTDMPLIVYLHGGSGRGSDLSLVTSGSLPKFIQDGSVKNIRAYVLMPQCPSDKTWEQIATSVEALIDKTAADKKIDIKKISLTGHSLGGSGTWKLGSLYASKFSCIAPLSGSVTASTATSYKTIPVWAFVGSDDTVVDPAASTTIVPMINNLGGNAQVKVYAGATHFDVPDLVYKDTSVNIISWLIGNSKN